jgi:flagellar hook-associated protein 3 FlgL
MYRISTSQMIQNGLNGIYKNQSAMNDAISAISSGKRTDLDPVEQAQSLSYRVSLSNNEQNNRNISTIEPRLTEQENSISNIDENIKRLSELSIKLANPIDSYQKQSYLQEYNTIRQDILSQLNSKDSFGEYQFSGFSSRTEPFDTNLNYNGDQGVSQLRIGNTALINLNIPGEQIVSQNFKSSINKLDLFFSNSSNSFDNSVITDLNNTQSEIGVQLAKIGGKFNTLTLAKTYNQNIIDSNTAQISQIEDLDMAKALTDFSKSQTAYQASLKTQSIIQNLSLFNYI